MPIQEPKPNRSMMEPAEDWYRCDAADEDFFNSLLESRGYPYARSRSGCSCITVRPKPDPAPSIFFKGAS